MKLRRKPLVHEAHIFDGTEKSAAEARFLLENKRGGASNITFTKPTDGSPGFLTVSSKDGRVAFGAKPGDYLVKTPDGEIVPMAPAVVTANFDVIT
jgi:hypothetical protein